MTEPASATSMTLAATGVSIAAMMPNMDGNALIGAFAGATLFAVSAHSRPLLERLLYLMVSLIGGYLASGELVGWGMRSSGLAAFFSSAVIVTLTLAAIERAKAVDIFGFLSWIRRGGPPNA